uniref:Uncharacterized protein n=1 Tax=Rhodnius prolixus TaxID=13249 RepID=T1I4G1_RHOPR
MTGVGLSATVKSRIQTRKITALIMKKYTVLLLSILMVYSECLPFKDLSKEVKINADTALSEFRPETDDSPRATTVETLLESNEQPSEETATLALKDWIKSLRRMQGGVRYPAIPSAAINAMDLCDSGFQKGPSGKCRRVFG